MDVRLLVANTSSAAKLLRLGPKTLVGRSTECNLRIASDRVSRRHCLVKVGEHSVTIRDLGSSNGTQLNGELITPQTEVEVTAGSMLVVGPLKFIVQFAAPKIKLDEDTEWLPLMPDLAKSAAAPGGGIESLIPPAATGMEVTKDLPAEMRWRSATIPKKQGGVADEYGSTVNDTDPEIDAGRSTKPDLGAFADDSVLDMPQAGGSVADGLRRQASETFLLFEEDDLEQLTGDAEPGSTGFSSDRETPPPDDGMDDELRRFLTGS